MRLFGFLAVLMVTSIALAQASVSPSYMNFGSVDLDGPSFPIRETFWFTNHSDQTLQLRVQAWGCGREFEVTDYCSYVPAYGTCTGRVSFQPNYSGHYSCDISIEDWSGSLMPAQRIWLRGSAYKR